MAFDLYHWFAIALIVISASSTSSIIYNNLRLGKPIAH
jgi:hypothetical protein